MTKSIKPRNCGSSCSEKLATSRIKIVLVSSSSSSEKSVNKNTFGVIAMALVRHPIANVFVLTRTLLSGINSPVKANTNENNKWKALLMVSP